MHTYKEGDIVKFINAEGSDLDSDFNNREGILILKNDPECYNPNGDCNIDFNIKIKNIFGLENYMDNSEDAFYFRNEDIELVGYTYIPGDIDLNIEYTLTNSNLSTDYVSPSWISSKHKSKIVLDNLGYYISLGGNSVVSLANIDRILNYNIEIRLDNTIKIYSTIIFDILIIDKLKDIFYNYFEDCEVNVIESNSVWQFVIHFPDLIIINDYQQTHPIKDLYVIFTLRVHENRLIFKNDNSYLLNGVRTTLTEKEYQVGYAHSHLTMRSFMNTDHQFCLGSGPLNTNIPTFNMNNDLLIFEKIMLDIIDYVKVESNIGGPYITFDRVYQPINNGGVNYTVTQMEVEYKKFISHFDNFPISINTDLQTIVDEKNPEFIKLVSSITSYIKNDTTITINPNDLSRTIIKFKNKNVKLKIIKEDEQNKEQQQRIADQRVCKFIAGKLSERITNKAISRITRESKTGYFTGTLVEDTSITPKCGEIGVVRSIVSKGGRKLIRL